jgi:hypothetical protein
LIGRKASFSYWRNENVLPAILSTREPGSLLPWDAAFAGFDQMVNIASWL